MSIVRRPKNAVVTVASAKPVIAITLGPYISNNFPDTGDKKPKINAPGNIRRPVSRGVLF